MEGGVATQDRTRKMLDGFCNLDPVFIPRPSFTGMQFVKTRGRQGYYLSTRRRETVGPRRPPLAGIFPYNNMASLAPISDHEEPIPIPQPDYHIPNPSPNYYEGPERIPEAEKQQHRTDSIPSDPDSDRELVRPKANNAAQFQISKKANNSEQGS